MIRNQSFKYSSNSKLFILNPIYGGQTLRYEIYRLWVSNAYLFITIIIIIIIITITIIILFLFIIIIIMTTTTTIVKLLTTAILFYYIL